jgi:hypothetical protein
VYQNFIAFKLSVSVHQGKELLLVEKHKFCDRLAEEVSQPLSGH